MDRLPPCCGFLETPDAGLLRFGRWSPDHPVTRGTVLLLGGRSEFIEKYGETIRELNRRGFRVYSFDWRGQGLSSRLLADRNKGHIERFDQYLQDLEHVVREVVKPGQGDTLITLAHSMGGHLALRFVHDHPGIFDKVVLTAAMIDVHLAPVVKRLVHGLAATMVRYGKGHLYAIGSQGRDTMGRRGFRGNPLTSDRHRYERNRNLLMAQPALRVGGVTYAWLKAALDSIDVLKAASYLPAIAVPILMVIAGQDKVVSQNAQQDACRVLPNCRSRLVAGARHEILMEVDPYRNAFWQAFDRFT
jgi:lysophospholipase